VSDSVTTNTRDLVRYLLRESDLLRSPVFIFVVIASGARTSMIFLINETAERGSPDLLMFFALIGSAVAMLSASHWAKMSGVALVQRLNLKMRQQITNRILAADVSFFQNRPFGSIFHASTGHVGNVAATALRLVEISQAVLLLIFCLIYLALQMPISVVATVIAFLLGVAAFFLTEKPATRAVKASHEATIAFHDSVRDMLNGYKELRLRRARRDDLSDRTSSQIKQAQSLTIVAERHYSYGQISATAALAALLISVVAILPLFASTDSVTTLQILTLLLFSFGPIESMVGDLPLIARAGVSFQVFTELDEALAHNAEHPSSPEQIDHRVGFRSLELRDVTVRLTREVGGESDARDSFTLGPINLTLYPGQSVFITGGNGTGKSTLLHLLTGLQHADSGEILIDGQKVTRATVSDYRAVFAVVFSEFYMFRQLYGLTPEERSRLQINIEELGLAEGVSITGNQFANLALSTGQMRRLALSIALAEKRPIIVLDEFAADQDPVRRAFFYDILVPRLAGDGHCVVAVTHDEHCFGKADRLIRMENGKIVSDEAQKHSAQTG